MTELVPHPRRSPKLLEMSERLEKKAKDLNLTAMVVITESIGRATITLVDADLAHEYAVSLYSTDDKLDTVRVWSAVEPVKLDKEPWLSLLKELCSEVEPPPKVYVDQGSGW